MSSTVAPLILGSDLPGRPVVSIDCGDDIAEIKDVVFDPVTHQLVGFTLNKRGWFRGKLKATLPAASIQAIGPAAVMVHSSTDLVDPKDTPVELDTSTDVVTVIGSRVMSAGGDELGVVADVVLETGPSPRATGYQVDGEGGAVFVPLSAQIALSGDTLVLPETATDFIRNDLAGFGAAVHDYRQALETS